MTPLWVLADTVLLLVCWEGLQAHGQQLGLSLNGQPIANNSNVVLRNIGEGDAGALLCTTDSTACCTGAGRAGQWFYPDGRMVPIMGGVEPYYRNRGTSLIRLNRRPNQGLSVMYTGVYCCQIPDRNNVIQTLCVGAYLTESAGAPIISQLTFIATTRTLTCISMGGPATNVTWKMGGSKLTVDGSMYQFMQTLTEESTATYTNVLTIISTNLTTVIGSNFTCEVENTRGRAVMNITIPYPPPDVTIQTSGNSTAGETYTLSCTATIAAGLPGNPTVSIGWLSPSGTVTSGSGITLGAQATQGTTTTRTLTFNPVRVAHAGGYTCQATLSTPNAPTGNNTSNVSVIVPIPTLQVDLRPAAAVTYAGNNVNLRCAVTLTGGVTETDVRVNITWTKNGAPFSGVSGRVMMHGGIFTSTISYNQLQFSPLSSSMDNGTYVCNVTVTPVQQQFVIGASGAGSMILNVIVPTVELTLTPNTTRLPNVAPYNTFSLTCTATSSVQGSEVAFTKSFAWSYQMGNRVGATTGFTTVQMGIVNRDLSQARSTSELTVSETTAGMYTYRCQANLDLSADNIFGRNDYYPITVTGPSDPEQPTSLRATGTSFNGTIIQWTVVRIAYTPETYTVHFGTSPGSLTSFSQQRQSADNFTATNLPFSVPLTGLTPATDYSYQVVATNTIGRTAMSAIGMFRTLDIRAPNITELTFDVESRTLSCTSTGGPATTVTWTKDGAVITPNTTHGHQQTQMIVDTVGGIYQYTLTIAQSVTGDNLYGLYSCMVENSRGSSNRTAFFGYDLGLRLRHQSNHTAYNIRDNSIVRLAALGTLLCTTPYQPCCQNRGHWHYPNESVVPTNQDGSLLFTSRTDHGRLDLQRRAGFNHESADGVYECQIPDENGRTQTLYTWIYSGPLSVLQESPVIVSLNFILTSVDDPTFVLTCTSTIRPPTYITWTRDRTELSDDSIHSLSQSLVNRERATYVNTLTVTGRLPGRYGCQVTTEGWESQQNFTQSASKNITVIAANAPTGLAAEVVGDTSIRVSWTAPTSGAAVTGYHVNYQEEDAQDRVTNRDSVNVGASVSEYNITHGLTAGHSYNITVHALSQHLPSPAVVSPTVTLAPSTPTITAAVSQSPTSITLTWIQPEGEVVDSYELVFSYQGPCDSFTHTSTITVDGTTRQYTLTGLQELSTFTINITAANVGGKSAVTSQSVTTRAGAPTAAPQTVTASITGPTIVFVTWRRVDCIDHNSEISRYTVRYGPVGGTAVNASVPGTNHLAYTLVGLIPSTNYSIEVAAVNSDGGVGPFSPPIFVRTLHLANTLVLNGTVIPNHGLVLLEDIGESDAQSLLCLTNRTDCCQPPQSPGGEIGNWFFPNGSRVLNKGDGWDFYTNRGPSVVRMHRRRGGVTGIYYCKIPDDNAGVQILYVGVYTNTTGALEVMPLQFQLTSELTASTPTFTLTCTSTGCPATTVSWTVNNHTATEDSNHHITSQILSDPETATYNHTLTVTGRRVGWYECSISNTKSSSNRSLMVVGATPPTNLTADPDGPTSIKVSWLPPASGATVTGYQIFYRMLGSDNNHVSVDIPANKKQHTLSKLQGGFVYTITMVTKSNHLPSTVTGPIRATLAMVSKVMVRAANATALLVSWDALQDSYLLHYTIYYSAFSPPLGKVVDRFTKVISFNRTSDIVHIRKLTAGVEHEFQVTASLEIEGVVYEGVKSVPAKMVIDEAVFQLQMGPVTSCAAWSTNKAEKMESYIHIGIAKIISDRCNCEFQATFIRSGIFHCWNAPDEVTYRSVIVGTGHHNATKLLRFLEEWVNSEPVLQVEKLGLWLSTKCPVKISSLSAPQCPSFRQPPAGAQCGNVCTCTVRSEHLQTSTAVPKDEGSA